MVDFEPSTKRYSLGLGTVEIARAALSGDGVVTRAMPMMRMLAEKLDAAIGLWRAVGKCRLTLIGLAESEASTRIHMAVGHRQPYGAGATGRSLLAASGALEEELRTAFDQIRWQRSLSFAQYARQVATAGKTGFAWDREWMHPGITTIASAVEATDASHSYCLSASVFSAMCDEKRMASLGCEIRTAAEAL